MFFGYSNTLLNVFICANRNNFFCPICCKYRECNGLSGAILLRVYTILNPTFRSEILSNLNIYLLHTILFYYKIKTVKCLIRH
jgi:hypothetical protein